MFFLKLSKAHITKSIRSENEVLDNEETHLHTKFHEDLMNFNWFDKSLKNIIDVKIAKNTNFWQFSKYFIIITFYNHLHIYIIFVGLVTVPNLTNYWLPLLTNLHCWCYCSVNSIGGATVDSMVNGFTVISPETIHRKLHLQLTDQQPLSWFKWFSQESLLAGWGLKLKSDRPQSIAGNALDIWAKAIWAIIW